MLRFIINRLIAMVLTLFAVSVVAFAIIQLPPGDYLTTYVATLNSNGDRVDPSTIEALRQQYGFGEPFLVQYWKWISGIVGSGDFGQSFEWKAPVTSLSSSSRVRLTRRIQDGSPFGSKTRYSSMSSVLSLWNTTALRSSSRAMKSVVTSRLLVARRTVIGAVQINIPAWSSVSCWTSVFVCSSGSASDAS